MGFFSKVKDAFWGKSKLPVQDATDASEDFVIDSDLFSFTEDEALPTDKVAIQSTEEPALNPSPAKIVPQTPAVLGYSATNTKRGTFVPAEYDLAEIGIIEDVDGIVAQAFQKKLGLFFKEGFSFVGSNKKTLDYIKGRLRQIEVAGSTPTPELLRQIANNLIKTSNAFLYKVRKEEASGGRIRIDAKDNEKIPVAAYFSVPPETMEAEINGAGKITKWRQSMPDGRIQEYKVDDIVHFKTNKKDGFLFGTPTIVPVIDDIRALRQIEENIELLVYHHVFPLFHYIVGTETAPAGFTESGYREIDVAKSELRYMPAEGGIVTPERHEIKLIGAEGRALRAEGYLDYFKRRVVAGLGISEVDLGIGDTANRATANVLSRALIDSVKNIQDSLEAQFDFHVIQELLLESPYGEEVLLDKNLVHLKFAEIDIANKIEQEKHALELFKGNGLTYEEYRAALGLDPIPLPDDPHTQDIAQYPQWFSTYWKLIEEPTLLIRAIDEAWSPQAQAAAEARSTSMTSQGLASAQQASQEEKKAVAAAKAKPAKPKDSVISTSYKELEIDTLQRIRMAGKYDEDFAKSHMRAWVEYVMRYFKPQCFSALLNGFDEVTGNQSGKGVIYLKTARNAIERRIEKYALGITNDLVRALTRRINTLENTFGVLTESQYSNVISGVFESIKYRLSYLESVEVAKAYNYGLVLGLRFIGADNFHSVYRDNSSCEVCKGASQQVINPAHATIDDVVPHHPNCKCRIVYKAKETDMTDIEEEEGLEDGEKFERCVLKVKKSLRERNPSMGEKEVKSRAYSICTAQLKK